MLYLSFHYVYGSSNVRRLGQDSSRSPDLKFDFTIATKWKSCEILWKAVNRIPHLVLWSTWNSLLMPFQKVRPLFDPRSTGCSSLEQNTYEYFLPMESCPVDRQRYSLAWMKYYYQTVCQQVSLLCCFGVLNNHGSLVLTWTAGHTHTHRHSPHHVQKTLKANFLLHMQICMLKRPLLTLKCWDPEFHFTATMRHTWKDTETCPNKPVKVLLEKPKFARVVRTAYYHTTRRMPSSGMWRRGDLVRTAVSEERPHSIRRHSW
jgi:hypothetical protein